MGNAIILSENKINIKSTITASSGISIVSFLYDRDINTRWKSVGSNDTIVETITVNFNKNVNLDRIILLKHNIKSIKVKKEGTIICENANITTNYLYANFSKIETQTILIECLTTQIANQEKNIGELILCEHYYTLETNPTSISAKWREKSGEVNLADGTLKMWRIYQSERFGEDWEFENISYNMINVLKEIKTNILKNPFLVYPFPEERPLEVYLCNWTNAFECEPQQAWNENNRVYNLRMELREV